MTEINKNLQQLVGLKLTLTTRAANMECFKFGTLHITDSKNNLVNIGEFGLHLQCPWRMTNESEILVGDNDLYEKPYEDADFDEDFEWDEPMSNLRDLRIDNILKGSKLIVQEIRADDFGGLEILFDNKIKLTVFPNSSSQSEYNEFWRLLDNRPNSKSHFVVTPKDVSND